MYTKNRPSLIYTTLLGHTFVHCLKSLTAAKGRVVFIPYVAGQSINTTKHCRLVKKQIANTKYNYKLSAKILI